MKFSMENQKKNLKTSLSEYSGKENVEKKIIIIVRNNCYCVIGSFLNIVCKVSLNLFQPYIEKYVG